MNRTTEEHKGQKIKRRYRIFAREYLVDLNGKRAAIAAGYSQRSAEVTASRLLKKPRVQRLIKKLMDRRAEKLDLTGEKVLRELARLAFANMIDYIDIGPDGSARVDFSHVDRDKGAAIQEVDIDEYSKRRGPQERKQAHIRDHQKDQVQTGRQGPKSRAAWPPPEAVH